MIDYLLTLTSKCAKTVMGMLFFAFLSGCVADIVFKSSPEGAKVVDERQGELGITPFTKSIYISPAPISLFTKDVDFLLTFSLPGYQEVKKNVYNVKSSMVIMLELEKMSSHIYVKTNPPGAMIEFRSVDGEKLESIPEAKINGRQDPTNRIYEIPVKTKELIIVMSKQGYRTRTETVKIDANKENHFYFPLSRISAEVNINSTPQGAEIHERALGFLGQTPLIRELSWNELRRLSIGKDVDAAEEITLRLTLTKPNYKPLELIEKIAINKDIIEQKSINATLSEEFPITLIIETNPPNAELYEKSLGPLGTSPIRRIISPNDISRLTHKENNDAKDTVSLFLVSSKNGYVSTERRYTLQLNSNNPPLSITLEKSKEETIDSPIKENPEITKVEGAIQ